MEYYGLVPEMQVFFQFYSTADAIFLRSDVSLACMTRKNCQNVASGVTQAGLSLGGGALGVALGSTIQDPARLAARNTRQAMALPPAESQGPAYCCRRRPDVMVCRPRTREDCSRWPELAGHSGAWLDLGSVHRSWRIRAFVAPPGAVYCQGPSEGVRV